MKNENNTLEIAEIISIFHDGTIEEYEFDSLNLKLKINCQYLAEIIDPSFQYFYLTLNNVMTIELFTFSNTQNKTTETPIVLTDLTRIFQEEIDIFRAVVSDKIVSINCWIVNEKLGFVANKLNIECNQYELYDEANNPISFACLVSISEKYRNEFRNQNSR